MIDTHYDDPRLSIVAEHARCATNDKDLRAILHVCYNESWLEANQQTWHLWSRLASQIERRLDEMNLTPRSVEDSHV